MPSSNGVESVSDPQQVVEVRRAEPQDYQAVLGINTNVYHGTDYLPAMYHDQVIDPDFCYYVCLVDGEVAAFEGVALLDNNKTIMLRSLRIKTKFQRQGMATLLRRRIYEDFKGTPNKKYVRHSCSEESRFVRSTVFLRLNRLLKKEKRVRFSEVDVQQMSSIIPDDTKAKPISCEDFGHMISNPTVKKFLYPDNIMTHDYWFYDAELHNIRHLKKRCPLVIITRDLYKFLPTRKEDTVIQNDYSNGNEFIDDVSNGIVGLLISYFSPEYLYMAVNLSGKLTNGGEMEEITAIFKQVLFYAQTLYLDETENRKLSFGFVYDHTLPDKLLHDIVQPFGFTPAKSGDNFKEQYYFEQNFDTLVEN